MARSFLNTIVILALASASLLPAPPADAQGKRPTTSPDAADSTPVFSSPPPVTQQAVPPPLPTPAAEATTYFMEDNGQPRGPLSLQQVREMMQSGRINRRTLLWHSGSPSWQAAEEIAHLRDMFTNAPPPIPPEAQVQQLLAGQWEEQSRRMNITMVSTVRFAPNGTYSGMQRSMMAGTGAPSMVVPATGRWRAEPVSDGRFLLTLTPQDGGPAQNATYTIIDRNTLRNEDTGAVARRLTQ